MAERDTSRQDACRQELAANGLTPSAVTHLTRDALGTIDLDKLAPVKQLLKRFFSAESWTSADDDALADLVGPGTGWFRHDIGDRIVFEFGWRDAAFRLALSAARPATPTEPAPGANASAQDIDALAASFAGPVVPEATPNPRTIRFVTPPIHDGPSRWYESSTDADDPRVARLFADFDAVANVLVGPDFVAVGLHRPDQWEQLLDSVLRVVTTEFASGEFASRASADGARTFGIADGATAPSAPSALERAWRDLGSTRPGDPDQLGRLLVALTADDVAIRQVAARVMIDADADIARDAWSRLLDDPSRAVRRATVDAMVDAARPALRSLLERAVTDPDAWIRWKGLRGLVDLGIEPSLGVVIPLAEDPDFRVRLESARALRTRD